MLRELAGYLYLCHLKPGYMLPKGLFYHVGEYFILLCKVFGKPEKHKIYYKQFIKEVVKLGISSIGIVAIISAFMGAVITIQTAYNIESPLLPPYLIGLAARDSILLEFSSTMVALILAGKVGSSIASEIGTMRVTEQIDALEIMGVNSASYLILPKICAAMFFNPFLTLISMTIGIFGGWAVGTFVGVITTEQYIAGIRYSFNAYYITYSVFKTIVFAFIITSVSAYYGYGVKGGSIEVGQSSTRAVVYSCVIILMFNLLLTQLLLS
jgi:phospholipid/cholesterol/gamma-HCH transport system permease protein